MLDCQFYIHAGKGPVIIMNRLKPIYNGPFKDSHSHLIHTCFPIIASNGQVNEAVPSIIAQLFHVQRESRCPENSQQ